MAEAPAVEVDAQEATPVVEETAPETPPVEEEKKEQDEFPTRKEVAEAFANVLMPIVEKQNEAFEAITKQIEALSAEVETLKKSDTEKIADVAKEMPMASLTAHIMGSIIGNKAVAVKEGSALAEAKPKEAEFTTDESPRTGIPFIDKMITPAGKQS